MWRARARPAAPRPRRLSPASFPSARAGLLGLGGGVLLGGDGAQLQGVDAALGGHLVLEQGVDHAVAGGPHLGTEGVGRDDEAEVRLARRLALHGLVVRVQVRVVEDLKARRGQRRRYLEGGGKERRGEGVRVGLRLLDVSGGGGGGGGRFVDGSRGTRPRNIIRGGHSHSDLV